jgi:hypothetical protein
MSSRTVVASGISSGRALSDDPTGITVFSVTRSPPSREMALGS